MNLIRASNAPMAFVEAFAKMRVWAIDEESRNGPVRTVPDPVTLEIIYPDERVLFDPIRDANPFFHLFEAIWMFAGEQDVRWLEQFNARYRNYADPGTDLIHGAYGHRWRRHFADDQLLEVVRILKEDFRTRRGVMGLWDPNVDLAEHNDLPCNTQIMFRNVGGELNMTVINRSNDLVWGMLGANIVHMTMLHELVSSAVDVPMGTYRVFTQNLHVYRNLDNFEKLWGTIVPYDPYRSGTYPKKLLRKDEDIESFLGDAENFVAGGTDFQTEWFRFVAVPMLRAYRKYRQKKLEDARYLCGDIESKDWEIACVQWLDRRIARAS